MRPYLVTFLVILLCRGSAPTSATTTDASTTAASSSTNTIPSSEGSTSSGGSTSDKGSTTTAVTNTVDPSASTPSPGTATTTATNTPKPVSGSSITPEVATTEPYEVTTQIWKIPLNNTDPTDLLREITILTNQVTTLKANLTDLYNDMDPNGANNYITQLQNLNNTIAELQSNTSGLADKINETIAIYATTLTNIQPLLDRVYCFSNSCSVAPSPTPSPCPENLLNANTSWQSFSYESGLNYNCTTTIRNSDGNSIEYLFNLTVTGSAKLTVTDQNGTKDYTTNQNNTSGTPGPQLLFIYRAEKENDTISLNVNYRIVDPCEGYDCSGQACVPINGNAFCHCNVCYGGDHCEVSNDPCLGSQVERKCKKFGGNCTLDDSDGTCNWKCYCPSPLKQVDSQTCATSSSDSMLMEEAKKWLYWKN